jgi:transcription initiation factor TFIID TATA-box-binding protein
MPKTTPLISIENVVASAGVNQPLDLSEITRLFPDVGYNPQVFPGLAFRLKAPKTCTLIFRTGKMVCTGAKSEELAFKAVQTVVQKLRKSGIKIQNEPEVKIQNIVASVSLGGGRIKLEEASMKLTRSLYEPEQFLGLVLRVLEPKTVILVFASGKLVCTGAKKEEEVYQAVSNLHTLLENEGLMVY